MAEENKHPPRVRVVSTFCNCSGVYSVQSDASICISIFIKEFNGKCFAITQNIYDGTFSSGFDPGFGIISFQDDNIEQFYHIFPLGQIVFEICF